MGRARNPGVLTAILTEHLAWRLMRQEIPEASGVAYARLTLHFTDTGETRTQGLYVLVEDIDRAAIRSRFGADQGLLVKTTDLGCVDEVEFDDGAPNSASDLFAAWRAARPTDFPGGWTARTDEAMHLDELLRQEALRELLANTGDTVLGNRNNYYAFDPYAGRRWYLPWDLDDMFRPFPQVRAADTPLVHACTGGSGCTPNPSGAAIRDNAEIRPRYLELMCRLASGVARESKLLADLQALDAPIRPIIETEVPVLWAPAGKNPLDVSVEGTYASEVGRMKTWIPARVQAVRRMIEAEGVDCPASCQAGATATCAYYGLPSQRVCAGGVWGDRGRIAAPPGSGGTTGTPLGASGATGLAGTGGASGSGATSGSGGMAGAASSSPPGVTRNGSGCGCTIESPTGASPWFLLLWLIMVARPPPGSDRYLTRARAASMGRGGGAAHGGGSWYRRLAATRAGGRDSGRRPMTGGRSRRAAPSGVASSAASNAAAEGWRSAGAVAIARATTASSDSESPTFGATSRMRGTGLSSFMRMMSPISGDMNGFTPVSISNSTTPTA